jgi:hypothetical protein
MCVSVESPGRNSQAFEWHINSARRKSSFFYMGNMYGLRDFYLFSGK